MNGLWEPLSRYVSLPGDPAPLRRDLALLRANADRHPTPEDDQ